LSPSCSILNLWNKNFPSVATPAPWPYMKTRCHQIFTLTVAASSCCNYCYPIFLSVITVTRFSCGDKFSAGVVTPGSPIRNYSPYRGALCLNNITIASIMLCLHCAQEYIQLCAIRGNT
jgi:hypothetical protein